ncbi:MAG: hypothetical protein EA403_05515 [Spirochaetaceae bacterium]|nr:MAG: hypothetical protein EA403_05515 [Spirochaetaceae bacterium]
MTPRNDQSDIGNDLDAKTGTVGIPSAELEEIRAHIDGVFSDKASESTAERLDYTPQRSAAAWLIALNTAAIALTAAALFGLWTLLQPTEASVVATMGDDAPAQTGLFERFRQDAAGELSEREREIAGIRSELERLALAGEEASVDPATVDRIAALEAALRDAQDAELAASQRVESMDLLSRLQRVQQQEQLLATQLSVALGRIADLEVQLESAAAVVAPAADPVEPRESPLDRRDAQLERELRVQLEGQLDEQIRETQRLREEIERVAAERDAMAGERAALQARQGQLVAERDRWQTTAARLEREAAARVAADQQRAQLRSRIVSATNVLAAAPVAVEPSRNEVIDAVGSKVEVMSILSDEPIRSRNPGLDGRLEHYLDALVTESRRAGRLEGLADAKWLLQRARTGTLSATDLAGRFTATERRELQQLLTESEALVR